MKTILVADDYEVQRNLVSSFLEKKGYRVIKASDGLSAYNYFINGEAIDMLVSDLEMPNMTGLELASRVRRISNYRNIPIIMSTTRTPTLTPQLQSIVTCWFNKPFDVSKFLDMVAKLL